MPKKQTSDQEKYLVIGSQHNTMNWFHIKLFKRKEAAQRFCKKLEVKNRKTEYPWQITSIPITTMLNICVNHGQLKVQK